MAIEEKCCCTKEPLGTIPIGRIISKLDALFAKDEMEEAGRVLEYWESEARALNDTRGLSEILSEELGYYRKVGNAKKGLRAATEALGILACTDVGDSVANATIYLNCATTMKAFGKAAEAMPYYAKAKEVYERLLPKDDARLAGLYNNYATALADVKNYAEARENYVKAINILKTKQGAAEIAVSYVNLAQMVYDESEEKSLECDDEIDGLLSLAYEYLDGEGLEHDGNYAYICSKCASAFGFFGWFLQKEELEKRANKIYGKE